MVLTVVFFPFFFVLVIVFLFLKIKLWLEFGFPLLNNQKGQRDDFSRQRYIIQISPAGIVFVNGEVNEWAFRRKVWCWPREWLFLRESFINILKNIVIHCSDWLMPSFVLGNWGLEKVRSPSCWKPSCCFQSLFSFHSILPSSLNLGIPYQKSPKGLANFCPWGGSDCDDRRNSVHPASFIIYTQLHIWLHFSHEPI